MLDWSWHRSMHISHWKITDVGRHMPESNTFVRFWLPLGDDYGTSVPSPMGVLERSGWRLSASLLSESVWRPFWGQVTTSWRVLLRIPIAFSKILLISLEHANPIVCVSVCMSLYVCMCVSMCVCDGHFVQSWQVKERKPCYELYGVCKGSRYSFGDTWCWRFIQCCKCQNREARYENLRSREARTKILVHTYIYIHI